MADPAGALWFALLQLLILSLSQEICPLRGLSTQSTSSSFTGHAKTSVLFSTAVLSVSILTLFSWPFPPPPFTVLSLLPAASLRACTSCPNLMDGGPLSGSLLPAGLPLHPARTCAPTNSALLSSRSHMHLRLHLLVALITIPPPLRGPRGGYPGELHADTYGKKPTAKLRKKKWRMVPPEFSGTLSTYKEGGLRGLLRHSGGAA
ncbi:hypothetical protein B0H13DRAFT_1871640 [Mycena leptocephala]|nr:hypothetical protein B0H13DRAFT_1871640 [Mycena leptocephala]